MDSGQPVLKIWQANLDRARHAADEIREAAHREGVDILLLQEPYVSRGSVAGFGIRDAVVINVQQGARPWAAVVVLNRGLNVLHVGHLSTTHTVCVEVTSQLGTIVMASCYMQYAEPTENYIQELRAITQQYRNHKTLIGVDANAKSPIWGSPNEDRAGRLVEEYMAEANLTTLNDPTQGPTFSADAGDSFIDLTLAGQRMCNMNMAWNLRPNIITSSHKLIEIVIRPQQPVQHAAMRVARPRYNMNRADWTLYSAQLEQQLRTLPEIQNKQEAYDYARQLHRAITRAADASIPKMTYYKKRTAWWNNTLTDLKKMTHAARRDMQQQHATRDQQEERKDAYRTIRRIYTSAIRATKKESWREFVTTSAQEGTWGIPYKLQAEKLTPSQVMHSITTPGGQTATWRETATTLLDTLIQEDVHATDDPQHREIRRGAVMPPDTGDAGNMDLLDLELARAKARSRTAPGMDNITQEMVRRGWDHLHERLLYLYNACLQHGAFPRAWKHGQIKALMKDRHRDRADPKSYRPICLLPVIGKLFERLLVEQLDPIMEEEASQSQYGFRKGRSTEDAITALFDHVSGVREKHAMAIFYDFEGAFDTLWWPSVLTALQRFRCPRNIYAVIQDYLRGRTVSITENYHSVWKPSTLGCPQGSVLGPKLWNAVMDGLLRLLDDTPDAHAIAYADDLVVIIEGNSRRELERKAAAVMGVVTNWTQRNKLRISERKTVGMMLKGNLDPDRPPTVRLGRRNLQFAQQTKYLGVTIQAKMKIDAHIRETARKAKNIFHALARLGGASWGYQSVQYDLLYRTLFQQICAYAAHGWARGMNQRQKNILLSAQRQALIRCAKAYATVPTSGMPVIMGILPIDLYIDKRIMNYKLKKGLRVQLEADEVHQADPEDADGREVVRRRIEEHLNGKWQDRWDAATTGRLTHEFLPDVTARRRQKWIRPGHHVTQFLTGHGSFKAKLASLGLAEDGRCHCYQPGMDDARHVLYQCTKYNGIRRPLQERAQLEDVPWPPEMSFWMTKAAYPDFSRYARRVLRLREDEEPRRRRERPA